MGSNIPWSKSKAWLAAGTAAGVLYALLAHVFSRAKKNRVDPHVSQVAEAHAKLCLDPSGLIRRGKFGGIDLFDRPLEQQIGFMDARALRAMYEEHVLSKDSKTPFSPPHNPNLRCTPETEFGFVVGTDGIDIVTWELKPQALPTYDDDMMVEGRNAKTIEEVMSSSEAKRSGLRNVEAIALRLYSGKFFPRTFDAPFVGIRVCWACQHQAYCGDLFLMCDRAHVFEV